MFAGREIAGDEVNGTSVYLAAHVVLWVTVAGVQSSSHDRRHHEAETEDGEGGFLQIPTAGTEEKQ